MHVKSQNMIQHLDKYKNIKNDDDKQCCIASLFCLMRGIQVDISVVTHFSYIASSTRVNLRWRSSGAMLVPLLPHKNLIWNSVRKASDRSSSFLQPSRAISAFLRNSEMLSANFRLSWRCDQTIERPQSSAEFSHGDKIADVRLEQAMEPLIILVHYLYEMP